MCDIIPGILERDWESIETKINQAKDFSKTIHIDIIDGKFAPAATFIDPKPFAKFKNVVFLELHMMVEEPVDYLEPFAKAGFRRFLGHIEKMSDQKEFVSLAKSFGEAGLVLDVQSSANDLKVSLSELDALVIMTVKAGASGQAFLAENLNKIKKIKEKMAVENAGNLKIEIDGGINNQTISQVLGFNVDRCIANSALFNGDFKVNYNLLSSLV